MPKRKKGKRCNGVKNNGKRCKYYGKYKIDSKNYCGRHNKNAETVEFLSDSTESLDDIKYYKDNWINKFLPCCFQ
jgi:hypothetical protein